MPVVPTGPEGLSPDELDVNRRNTEAFIDAKCSLVTLKPRSRSHSGEGLDYTEGYARPTQQMRIIDQSSAGGPAPGTARSADGTQRKVEYQLLGRYDAVIGLYDVWTDVAGTRWEVADLLPYNGYERRAQVVRYGE